MDPVKVFADFLRTWWPRRATEPDHPTEAKPDHPTETKPRFPINQPYEESRDRLEVGTLRHDQPSPPRPARPFTVTAGARYGPKADEPPLSDTGRPNLNATEFAAPVQAAINRARRVNSLLGCPDCAWEGPGSSFVEHWTAAHGSR
jgi:hypothetical protein